MISVTIIFGQDRACTKRFILRRFLDISFTFFNEVNKFTRSIEHEISCFGVLDNGVSLRCCKFHRKVQGWDLDPFEDWH